MMPRSTVIKMGDQVMGIRTSKYGQKRPKMKKIVPPVISTQQNDILYTSKMTCHTSTAIYTQQNIQQS